MYKNIKLQVWDLGVRGGCLLLYIIRLLTDLGTIEYKKLLALLFPGISSINHIRSYC